MARITISLAALMLACLAGPVAAQSGNDPYANASLSSINTGDVASTGQIYDMQITGGQMNSITSGAQGAQTSVKNVVVESIAPDRASGGDSTTGGHDALSVSTSMIVGTTSTTINSGNTSNSGSYSGAVVFGDHNSLSIAATGASTSLSIVRANPGAPGGGRRGGPGHGSGSEGH